jgi:hypothetical protein
MSLFGFADIVFNKQAGPVKGPLKALDKSPFETSTLRYPEDIGNYDKGHYVVFYIREQEKTQFPSPAKNDGVNINSPNIGQVFENVGLPIKQATNYGSELLGKLNTGLGQLNSATNGALSGITGSISRSAAGIVGNINNLFGQKASALVADPASTSSILSNNIAKITNASFIQTTRLTKEAIALYMPDTLLYQQQQNYTSATLASELGGKIAGIAGTGIEAGYANAIKAAAARLGLSVAQTALGSQSGTAILARAGLVQNPLLELIYTSPDFRSFQFDFLFYARNEKEALDVQKIINSFRFHQCPEISQLKNFLTPPSEFDIRFYYGGSVNPNIPQIATCVLTNMQVNYAPNGFSAYEIPGESSPALGRTGMPVGIQMTLQFQETTFLTKQDFRDGNKNYYPDFSKSGSSSQPVTNLGDIVGP